jgi:hypothetical protein
LAAGRAGEAGGDAVRHHGGIALGVVATLLRSTVQNTCALYALERM